MKLTVISSNNDVHHLRCEGDVNPVDFMDETNPFVDVLGSDCFASTVLLNLDKTSSMDTSGIGWLVMSHKEFEQKGGRLVLHSIPPLIDHLLRLLKMPAILHIAPNGSAALALTPRGVR